MKKYVAIAILIILGVLIFKERYMLSLGFDYLLSKSQISANVDTSIGQPVKNPLEGFEIPTNEPDEEPQEISVEASAGTNEQKVEIHVEPNKPVNLVDTAPNTDQRKSFELIASHYNKQLTYLEKEFRGSLDTLIASAVSDYNRGSYKKLELAKQYLKKGEELEKISDTKFYGLLKAFESELLNSGYNTDLIKDVDKYYVAMKKAEKARIVNAGMSIVNN